MESKEIQDMTRVDRLFERVSTLIEQARQHVRTTVNLTEVYTKYEIGRYIIEDEQQGRSRAEYGKQLLKELSERLTEKYGKGWGMENLRLIRNFYLIYSAKIQNTVLEIADENQNAVLEKGKQWLPNSKSETVLRKSMEAPSFTLSWSHYLILMRIENPDARQNTHFICPTRLFSSENLKNGLMNTTN